MAAAVCARAFDAANSSTNKGSLRGGFPGCHLCAIPSLPVDARDAQNGSIGAESQPQGNHGSRALHSFVLPTADALLDAASKIGWSLSQRTLRQKTWAHGFQVGVQDKQKA